MRATVLLLLVVLAFLLVRWFAPAPVSAVEATPPEAATPADGGPRFLTPPDVAAERAPEAPESQPASARPEPARPAPEAAPTWPASLVPATVGDADEVRVASAIIHGAPADVQAAAAALPRDRALLLESFAWAVAGERKMALSLSEKISREAIDGHERALFETALTGRAATPASTSTGPILLAMEMALLERDARQALEAREFPVAARGYSSLLQSELDAPWEADRPSLAEWTKGLDAAQREHRWSPRGDWPSVTLKVQKGDSLIALRLRYLAEHPGTQMCTGLIERSNRLKGTLQPDQAIKVPTDPVRILVDLPARWALFFLGNEVAAAWPVGIGRPGEETPPGDYTVRNKLENPPWMKDGQEPIPFGDPRNPLGTRWMGWSRDGAKTSYGFHGTWEPDSIGQAASDGCIRFTNEHVEELFQILPEGAQIRIRG